MVTPPRGHWPKPIPPLTPAQQIISDNFMQYWHTVLPRRYGAIERFNHGFPLRSLPRTGRVTTLELGAGLGAHLAYEDLARQDYTCVELRDTMAQSLTARFPDVQVIVGDCQQRLPLADRSFDRVLAIHVLEHLPDLPAAVSEMARVLKPGGVVAIVMPCDPGALYGLCRRLSAERLFRQRYRQSYAWFIRREHLNAPDEILSVLARHFTVRTTVFFPFRVPVVSLNLCLGVLATKPAPQTTAR